jgi:hypothetical protein
MSKESAQTSHVKPAPASAGPVPATAGPSAPAYRGAPPDRGSDIPAIIASIESMMNNFVEDENIDTNLSGRERQRLFGAGVRNFGFIEKAYDIARENPQFLPPNFSESGFEQNINSFEEARQLFWVLQQFLQAVNEFMLIRADTCFRDALRVYGSLREQFRSRVPGAEILYRTLLTFFRRRRPRANEAEPTEKELERDFMKLIHGHADGKIEIINEQPHFSGGVHQVMDNVHTGHAAVKETAEAEIDERK